MNLYVGYANTCRVCLKKDEKSNLSIFDSLNESITYSDILTMVLHPVPIDMNPRLPQKLCQLCKENLIKMHNLRQLCFTSDRWIKSTLYGDVYLNANGFVVDGGTGPNVETMIIDSDAEENDPIPIPSFFLSQFQFDTPEVILQENTDSELQVSEMAKELHHLEKPVKKKRKCELCRGKFSTIRGYIRHQLKKHKIEHKNDLNTNVAEAENQIVNEPEKEQFDCEICHRKFTTLKGRLRHMAIHKNQSVLSDDVENSVQDVNLNNESSKDIEMMPKQPHVENYLCQKCSTEFACLQEYSKHMLRHMVVRLEISDNRMCQQCGLSYSTLPNLKRHQMQTNHKNIVK